MAKHECMSYGLDGGKNFFYRIKDNDSIARFKTTPRDASWNVIHVSEWVDIPFKEAQWLMFWSGEHNVCLSSRTIHELSAEVRRLGK